MQGGGDGPRQRFLAAVERARAAHPQWFDLPADQPAGAEDVQRAESELGCRLPEDFAWFLMRFGGGDFAMARIYSLDPASDLNLMGRQPPVPDFVAFSDDGTGNVYGFAVIDGECVDRVVIWDHELDDIRADRHENFLDPVARTALVVR